MVFNTIIHRIAPLFMTTAVTIALAGAHANAFAGEPACDDTCGNGIIEAGEGCDDGNTDDGDGCNGECLVEDNYACGVCEEGLTGSDSCAGGYCTEPTGDYPTGVCTGAPAPYCGDGYVDDGEQCDDGNDREGDGCDAECFVECVVECADGYERNDAGECACPAGYEDNGYGCEITCAAGYEFDDQFHCVPAECPSGHVLFDGECIEIGVAGGGCDAGGSHGGDNPLVLLLAGAAALFISRYRLRRA